MKFDLTKKSLLQSTIDTLLCDEQFAKEVIHALMENGEEFTQETVLEYGEKLASKNQ